jgi:sugar O-acyltransferase (sialic acid O-acetyltransferase NeuD family)
MFKKARFKLGKINANEDEATVVDVFINNNAPFSGGALLLVLETTKATVEIVSPTAGKIIAMQVKPGMTLRRGDIVFEAEFDGDVRFEGLELSENNDIKNDQNARAENAKKISYKAEKLANQLGLDISKLEASGDIIKEIDVRKYAEQLLVDNKELICKKSRFGGEDVHIHSGVKAIIFGAGGHARAILQMVREAGYCVVGIVDSSLPSGAIFSDEIPIIGSESDLPKIYSSGVRLAFIGVGGSTNNNDRIRIYGEIRKNGFVLPPLVSRAAHFETSSSLGEATYIFPGANVGANCTVGNNVIVNQGVSLCHDCKIGDHVHLAPRAILAGSVTVMSGTTIGMGATLMNSVVVGRNSLIHNLVAVNKNIADQKIVKANSLSDRI